MFTRWVKTVSGRIKSDPRIAPDLAYNAFPFPEPSRRRKAIETAAQAVLDARDHYPSSSLAALYDPLAMPPSLSRAHDELDRAVDSAYTSKTLVTDAERLTVLFARYAALTAGVIR